MDIEYFNLSLRPSELRELYVALLQRSLIEDDLRYNKGLEEVGDRPLLLRLEQLLRPADESLEQVVKALDQENWEHAWYQYTDEWAWFRAEQEVNKEIATEKSSPAPQVIERRIERKYRQKFTAYINEIDMRVSEKQNCQLKRGKVKDK